MKAEKSWTTARNILCVRLDSLGDVLMTSPAIRAIKEARAGRKVTLLTSPSGAPAAELIPEVDDVIVYEAPWMKATPPRSSSRPDYVMAAQLLRAEFDAAVIFTVFSQNPLPAAFLCYLADIPLRLAHCRENPYQLLSDWVPEPGDLEIGRHEVQRQLDLVKFAGFQTQDERLSVAVPSEARLEVPKKLLQAGLKPGQPWMVIHPGASAPSRRYPPESFARVVKGLVGSGMQVVLTGGQHERDLVHGILLGAGVRVINLAGKLNLGELAAVIERAPVLLSNNSGPVHLAAAVGTPVVDLYALTNPQHTPWMVPNRVLSYDVPCKYCYKSVCPEGHHNCLVKITPDEVLQAVKELLAEVAAQAVSAEVSTA